MKTILDKIFESSDMDYVQRIYNLSFGNDLLNSIGSKFDKLDEIFKYCWIFIDYQTVKNIISKLKSIIKSSAKYSDDDKKYIIRNLGKLLKLLEQNY